MAKRLLDRQVSLLAYLTSAAAVYGEQGDASLDPDLQGIDPGFLRLEACFSHEKRLEKIAAVLPRTFEILGGDQAAVVRRFTTTCPPFDISRIENAGQFHDFLCALADGEPPLPPHLADVAACELAIAKARVGARERDEQELRARNEAPKGGIRRTPGVVLLRCAYDIRPIFEDGAKDAFPARQETLLAIALSSDIAQPRVYELAPLIFDVLSGLDDWTDPATFGPASEMEEFVGELATHDLIEVRR